MKRKIVTAITALVCVSILFIAYLMRSPEVDSARRLIDLLESSNKINNWPHLGPLDSWNIQIDTYTNDVESSTIAELYSRTCRKLVKLYKDEVITYSWNDEEGWPRIATVVQFKIDNKPSSVLIVRAYQNNDNDSFDFEYRDGEFDVTNKKILSSWVLPKGSLRE